MTRRPDPPDSPAGYEYVAAPSDNWRLEAGSRCRSGAGGGRARVKSCGAPTVAAINRTRHNWRQGGTSDSWWAYCADHLYGHWIEDGRVMGWVLREMP